MQNNFRLENQIPFECDPKNLADQKLVDKLKVLVRTERKITAEILSFIREVERRRLYLNYHYTSMFLFLTKEIGYSGSAAQRRIESSRLLGELPEIKADLQEGNLNLSQVSLLAQCVRQKEKEDPKITIKSQEKKDLLNLIQNKDFNQSQKIIAQGLDLKVKKTEKKVCQKDESLMVEMTLTKEQQGVINRAKEISSHINPNPTMAELFEFLAKFYVQAKDPLRQKSSKNKQAAFEKVTTESVVNKREHIPSEIKRQVFQKYQICQWRDPKTNQICGSRFQLQIDHIKSIWRGGKNQPENLQLLCRVHNVWKFKQESKVPREMNNNSNQIR